jgi:acyl-CoA dehydrogenase
MDDVLLTPFLRLLDEIATPAAVRGFDAGDDRGIWSKLSQSGFLDALVCERDGGAGLQPGDIAELLLASAQHLLPAPFAETMIARALATRAGIELPVSPILLWPENAQGKLCSSLAPARAGAIHALVQRGDNVSLRELSASAAPTDGYGLVAAALTEAAPLASFALEPATLLSWSATLAAVAMTGAMTGVLDMTVDHVNTREQFGRKLGQFQAIQQQVALMAELTTSASIAARTALSRPLPGPSRLDAAAAKIAANEAARIVCASAHAAHGAIGVTAEHDLQLYIRRIKRAAVSFGASGFWADLIGEAHLAQGDDAGDFVRAHWSV